MCSLLLATQGVVGSPTCSSIILVLPVLGLLIPLFFGYCGLYLLLMSYPCAGGQPMMISP